MTNNRSLGSLTAEDFRDIKGSTFGLTIEHGEPGHRLAFHLEVAEVTQSSSAPADPFRTPFSVVFHGPIEPVLSQGTYRLEHNQLGVLELFIVPIGPHEPSAPGARPTAMRYEAVFG